ncbi:hypothetical protein [Sphingomonas sp. BK580]|uniref:hypothetical protein n=1 Tax=Sphingomonas sp. BK580 TaxID=2586972 RepID=UPI001620F2A3|nr:hypothetical protein [Sphingomonas sp. BK580]MBB3693583.1 hypothetical protein [Sphingomonas sp. BK580]
MTARSSGTSGLVAAMLLLSSGCVHTGGQGDFARFAEAAGKVHAQADLSFARANAISRRTAVDAFVASRRPGISERAFPPALDADAVAAWDAALSDLERYGSLVATLLDGGRGGHAAEAVAGLGRELQTGAAGAKIDPGVGAGFAALAGILVDASARSSARTIMRAADPAVRSTVNAMAGAIGRDRSEGLQGTVWSNWTTSLGGIRDQYAAAAEKGDEVRQRALAIDFLAGVDEREADLRGLASLRASLLALADAHAAAVAGSPRAQSAVIDGIDRRLSAVRSNLDLLGGAGR